MTPILAPTAIMTVRVVRVTLEVEDADDVVAGSVVGAGASVTVSLTILPPAGADPVASLAASVLAAAGIMEGRVLVAGAGVCEACVEEAAELDVADEEPEEDAEEAEDELLELVGRLAEREDADGIPRGNDSPAEDDVAAEDADDAEEG